MYFVVEKKTKRMDKPGAVFAQGAKAKYASGTDPSLCDLSFERNWKYIASSLLQVGLLANGVMLFGLAPVVGTVGGYFSNIIEKKRHTKLAHVSGVAIHAGTSGAALTRLFAAEEHPDTSLEYSPHYGVFLRYGLPTFVVVVYALFTKSYARLRGGGLCEAHRLIDTPYRYWSFAGVCPFYCICPVAWRHTLLCFLGNASPSLLVLHLNSDLFDDIPRKEN